ncbi:MAG: DUF4397 domain-containing protein [Spirosomataceae bacterium]
MKKAVFKNSFLAAGIAAMIMACGTEHDLLKDVQTASGARVKFFHAAPDAPGVALYVNDKKFSAVLTVAPATPGVITYGSVFPSTDYALVEAGAAKAKLIIPASGATAETTVFSGTVPVEADKYYSVFATGLAPTYGAVLIQDNMPAFNDRQVFFRVVNMIPNSTGVTASLAGNAFIEKVEYGKAGNFVPYNVAADFKGGSIAVNGFTFKVEGPNGVTVTTASSNITGLTGGRAVTIVVRGVLPTTPTGTTKYPITVSNYTNR